MLKFAWSYSHVQDPNSIFFISKDINLENCNKIIFIYLVANCSIVIHIKIKKWESIFYLNNLFDF